MKEDVKNKLFKWNCALSVLIILLVSAGQHFLYDVAPNVFVGIFAPRNESLAEHVKIVFYPVLLWWGISYVIFERNQKLNLVKWFSGGCVAVIVSITFVTLLFCTLFFGLWFPIDSFPTHISIEIVSILIAQLVGFHVYKGGKENRVGLIVLCAIVVAFAVLMAVFSYYPPKVPVFMSPQ